MTDHPAGTITIRGARHEIFVDDDGKWATYLSGHRQQADDKPGLAKLITRLTKQAATKVSVPFVMEYDRRHQRSGKLEYRRGTATGIHSSNSNVLVSWSDGEREQLSRYGCIAFGPDTDTDELARRRQAVEDAKAAVDEFLAKHKIDLDQKVRGALAEAMDSGTEE